MTSIQNQQTSKTDDQSKSTRRASNTSQNRAGPDAGKVFSNMVAASQRNLRAERLATMGSKSSESSSANRTRLENDNSRDDDTYASTSQSTSSQQTDGTQGQAGQGANAAVSTPSSAQIQPASEESLEWLSLASLLPAGEDDGLFEILMPNRGKVGVAVNDTPDGLSYLLMPEDNQLASRLRGHEMELEGYLKRRIRRNVVVAIL